MISQQNNYQNNYKNKQQQKKNFVYPERIDPVTAQAMIMRAEMYILLKYPNLIDTNKK